MPWSSFWMFSVKPVFSLSSLTFFLSFFFFLISWRLITLQYCSDFLFSFSSLRVKSSAYLRLLIFLPEILIPVCPSSSLAFCMMYSACKLHRQGDNTQPWGTPFPIWNQYVVPRLVLPDISWPAYRFLRKQIRWSRIPIFSRIFYSLLWST